MRCKRKHWIAAATAAVPLATHPAHAFEAGEVAGDPVTVDVTEASSAIYNADNRDSQPSQVATRANDDWGLWHNRLNLQALRGKWRLAPRLDTAWFFTSPGPTEIAEQLVEGRSDGPETEALFRTKLNEAGTELSNRYINWAYPAKLSLGYTARNAEATLGDFYTQLGSARVIAGPPSGSHGAPARWRVQRSPPCLVVWRVSPDPSLYRRRTSSRSSASRVSLNRRSSASSRAPMCGST